MPIELSTDTQQRAIQSIERYFRTHMDEPIGNVAAAGLLKFFLADIAPAVYNQGVADAQTHLLQRVAEVDIDVHHEAFTFWTARERTRRN
jgi:uncharacterized protein (DUF2164 family)